MPRVPSWRLSSWRTVDLIVVAVLAVGAGVIFIAWNTIYAVLSVALGVASPGLAALLDGVWLTGGLLPALVVRRPGAAVIGEVIAATVSAVIGNQWGFSVVIFGLLQGLAVEAGFALWKYRASKFAVAATAGGIGGFVQGISEIVVWYPGASTEFFWIYWISATVSGALLGGGIACLLSDGLRKTGILSSFGR